MILYVKGPGKALVPAGQRGAVRAGPGGQVANGENKMCPVAYTGRPVQAAKNYDVVSFARAMHDDFGSKVKKLFDPEREAALEAIKSGIYIGWRCPEFKHDCQRVGPTSKCFCGHLLNEHAKYSGKSVRVSCQSPCKCKAFAFVPSRPEEVGEFWFQRRRNFDPSTWRAKCKCKHSHDEHDPTGLRRCKTNCGCGAFDSNFLCCACDKHWEQHETFFDTPATRTEGGLPVGEDYLPFAEIPSLRNMALTGYDDEDFSYMSTIESPDQIRQRQLAGRQGGSPYAIRGPRGAGRGQPGDDRSMAPFGAGGGAKGAGGFNPTYK